MPVTRRKEWWARRQALYRVTWSSSKVTVDRLETWCVLCTIIHDVRLVFILIIDLKWWIIKKRKYGMTEKYRRAERKKEKNERKVLNKNPDETGRCRSVSSNDVCNISNILYIYIYYIIKEPFVYWRALFEPLRSTPEIDSPPPFAWPMDLSNIWQSRQVCCVYQYILSSRYAAIVVSRTRNVGRRNFRSR